MDDIILITVDSVRKDHFDAMEYVSKMESQTATAGSHYTRPSLSSILSSNYQSAAQSRLTGRSIADVLSDVGYTCIGLAPSPQLDEAFNFDSGFDQYYNFSVPGNRGSGLREFFAGFTPARKVYHRFFPPHAKMDSVPPDQEVIKEGIELFNEADSPCFLWMHLIETHRPYGRGEQAISKGLDRKALFSPNKLTTEERSEIETRYRTALQRADDQIEQVLDEVDGDPVFAFASDHGEEFGEEGRYFHQPQRRRTPETIVKVPIAFDGFDVPDVELASVLDVAPTLLGAVDIDPAPGWDGIDLNAEERSSAVTIAPWRDEATVRFETSELTITAREATVVIDNQDESFDASEQAVPDEIKSNLRELGYVE